MDKDQIQKELNEIKDGLDKSVDDKVKSNVQKVTADLQAALETKSKENVDKAIKENLGNINNSIKELAEWKGEHTEAFKANQTALDGLLSQIKEINKKTPKNEVKSFGEAFAEEMDKPENQEGLKSVSKGHPYKMIIKSASPILASDHLTGSGVITYNQRQAILPGQKVNFRDLIPSVHSDTGLYVTYAETGAQGTIGAQTEGAAKNLVDYSFTNVQTVNGYIAGYARFSKQMQRNLPWITSTLPRLLLRDFYIQENASFFATAKNAATGQTGFTIPTPADNDDVKALIDIIAYQQSQNYNVSYVLVNNLQLARFNKLFYTNLKYPGIGGLGTGLDGNVTVAGVPIIAAPWVTDEKALLIDNTFIERVEVESIAVEFFEQDSDNVQKNLITARIECYEALNPMFAKSMFYGDFGGAS